MHDRGRLAVPGTSDHVSTVSTSGIESEAPLAFAALQRLLQPLMPHVAAVAAPQARALRVAFGEEAGDATDRFLVFMGALSLLAAAAEEAPVLVVERSLTKIFAPAGTLTVNFASPLRRAAPGSSGRSASSAEGATCCWTGAPW